MKFRLLFLALLALAAAPLAPRVQAQTEPTTFGTFTNAVLTATNGQTLTINGPPITVHQDKGMAILPYFAAASAGEAANVTFNFDVTYDGTNWTTTKPITVAVAHNGTAAVRGHLLLDPTELNHVRQIRLSTVANAFTNTVYVTNVVWSRRN
jgi:hypothetical protein